MATIANIEEAIADIAAGKMVILVDDEDRENEGDLVIAAERVTPAAIAFMIEHARGLICLALDGPLLDPLELSPMTNHNQAPLSTAFTESIDAVDRAGSGASAADRARTILRAITDGVRPTDFSVPGHVFPLRAKTGGVLVRSGQTEGSVDLARLAGCKPAGVICEVMARDGTMRRLDSLLAFGQDHGIKVVTVADLIEHRVRTESLVIEEARSHLPTPWGTFDMTVYRTAHDDATHVALTMGTLSRERPTLVRVHRQNTLSDVFGFAISHSRASLANALARIAAEGEGALVHLAVPQDASTLSDALHGYVDRAAGRAPEPNAGPLVKMDFKEFGAGAQILRALGLGKLRVLTNSPLRLRGVGGFGLTIVAWEALEDTAGAVDTGSVAVP